MAKSPETWRDVAAKPSLNAWLEQQGFAEAVILAVKKGKLQYADVTRLKELRRLPRGGNGHLSKAQLMQVTAGCD